MATMWRLGWGGEIVGEKVLNIGTGENAGW